MMRHGLIFHYVTAVFSCSAFSFLSWYFFSRCCGMRSKLFNKLFIALTLLFCGCFCYDMLQFANGIFDSAAGEVFNLTGLSWLLGCAFSVVLLLMFAVIKFCLLLLGKKVHGVVRKGFFFLGVLAFFVAFAGMYNGWSNININFQEYRNEKVAAGRTLRVAYFSDLHLGNVYNLSTLNRILKQVAYQHPDVLFVGGDLFDDEREIKPAFDELDRFVDTTAIPVYFVLGNHEYYCNINKVVSTLSLSKVKFLNNKSAPLTADGKIFVTGVDYPFFDDGWKFDRKRADFDLRSSLTGVSTDSLRILLAHSPEYIEVIDGRKLVDLVLAGHTHGGQVHLGAFSLFAAKFNYLSGRYQLPNLTAIVSNGIGGWLPFRFNCPAEINIVDVKAK